MSWERPDVEPGSLPPPSSKPICTTRPLPSLDSDVTLNKYVTYKRGLRIATAIKNHWYVSRDAGDFHLRVVIPCMSNNPQNRFWQGRLIASVEGALRYTSPAGCQRGDALVVVHPLNGPSGTCLVEGPFDALAAADVGFLGIAWMGMNPGDAPIAFAKQLLREPVLVVADGDNLGAAVKIWKHFPGAYLVNPYPYKDLAEMPEDERRAMLYAL